MPFYAIMKGMTFSSLTRAAIVSGAGIAGWATTVASVAAQVFDGPGIPGGIDAADNINGLPQGTDLRATVIRILIQILSFLALAAVITVIIAGIYLIVGMGSDDSKDRAKKIIIYTLIGLVIVLLARVIVGLVTVLLASNIA